jgi:hypothetical protein
MNSLLLLMALAAGEPDAGADEAAQIQAEADETARFARDEADRWVLSLEDREHTKLELRREPILRWSNPAVGRIYGSVFVWTTGGRPAAVASLYRWYSPYRQRTAELVSLSPHALVATRGRQTLWTPPADVGRFRPVPGAAAPDTSSKRRPAQMRALARGFVPELTDRRVVKEGTRQQPRLLDKPVYQYGAGADGLLEGGLFAFVVGTDPEVLLVIEARETTGGREWHYALARMNRDPIRVRYGEQEVWSAPYIEAPFEGSREPYRLIDVGPLDSQD